MYSIKTNLIKKIFALLVLINVTTILQAQGIGTVSGSITYKDKLAGEKVQCLIIRLVDVSRQDTFAIIINEISLIPEDNMPIEYAVNYLKNNIDNRDIYSMSVTGYVQDYKGDLIRTYFSEQSNLVITRGALNTRDIVLTRYKK